jgi:thiosulfate/3-mercaptopyruvate sulfurtransferase
MAFTTLIETTDLQRRLDDQQTAIVDCRFRLDDPAWGEMEYEASHIPGAVYAHLGRDLAGRKTGTNGRHPLPDPAAFARTVGGWGIDADTQVVVYDQDVAMYASRLWWMLRWMGHTRVAVLNGGFSKWVQENRPVASGRESRLPRAFAGHPHAEMIVSVDDVAALGGRPAARLLDARAPERFRGENETIDKAAGHIPGAANHFFKLNVDERGTFLAPEALRVTLQQVLDGAGAEQTVCYCGSGVTACHNLLALEHAGLHGAKLYPGSWSEWSSDPGRPIER